MRPQVGQLINNKYRLVRLLGDGGMGSVFEATHEVLGSGVALKFLHPELARRQGLVQRFVQEARVSAKIHSSHVCRVVDVEQTPNGLPFMVMDLLKGKSLQTLYEDNYRAGVRLSYQEALDLAMQMLDGLEAAHEEGIVHRDLKPDNVMIVTGKRGEQICKLLDFGIAKLKINGEATKGLTRPGVIMGTPEYMAPEQVFSAEAVDARADVFSMGVMIFEMLAGRRPVGGDEAHQIAAAYISGNISKLRDLAPSVPQGLADVVHKAMAHDPKDRIQSVADLRAAIEPFARDAGIRATGSTPPPSPTNLPGGAHGTAALSAAALAQTASVAAVDGAETAKVSSPWRGDDVAAISAKLSNAVGNNFDSTVDAQPFFPGSTEAYQPASELAGAAPGFASTVAASGQARPGGTDVGAAALPHTADFGGQAIGPTPQVASYTPAAFPAPSPPRRKKSGMSLLSILGIAAAFTGLVVGGVYAYEEYGGGTSKSDKPKTVPLPSKQQPTAVELPAPDPQPVIQQPPQPTNPHTPPTVTTPPTRPPGPGPGPGPTPSTSSTSSNKPPVPIIPSVLPPGIPTTFQIPTEWGIPGMGGGTTPPPQPSGKPPSGGGKKPGRPGLEPIKEGALVPSRGASTPDSSHAEAPARRVLRPTRTEAQPSETRAPVETRAPTRTAREDRRPMKRARFKATGL
jgi:eukaryotic-like serine/threonine-protein kinase